MARTIMGVVSSRAGDKSIVVLVKTAKMHPIYKKRYTRTTKFMVHDEKNEAAIDDRVEIVETKPMSAKKHFSLSRIAAKAGAQFKDEDATADVDAELIGAAEEPSEEDE